MSSHTARPLNYAAFQRQSKRLTATQARKYRDWKTQIKEGVSISPMPSDETGQRILRLAEFAVFDVPEIKAALREKRSSQEKRAQKEKAAYAAEWASLSETERKRRLMLREKREARKDAERKARRDAEQEAAALIAAQVARIRRYGARLETMIEARLKGLGVAWTRSGFRFKWGSGNSRYWHVYMTEDGSKGRMQRAARLDEYLATIRLSDHAQPVGGGFSADRGEKHGDADLSIDPISGAWLDDIEPVVVAALKEAAR